MYCKTWSKENSSLDLTRLDRCGEMAEGRLAMENKLPKEVPVIL